MPGNGMQHSPWEHEARSKSLSSVDEDSVVATLYKQYTPKILAYLRLHIASNEDAEDVLLEVFVAALEREKLAERTGDEQQLWLWRVARNKMVDYHRRVQRRPVVALWRMAEMLYEDDAQAPEQVVLRCEEHEDLRLHMKGLSALQKEVLRLRFVVGMQCAEIAAVLDKREGAIRMLLSRSLNFLRSVYNKQREGNTHYGSR